MIKPIEQEPTRNPGEMERTPGRGDGLKDFAQKIISIYGSPLNTYVILDVGGGDGWLGEFLPSREYWCLDPMVHPMVTRPIGQYHIHGFGESMYFGDKVFDLVVSKQTLIHFRDPAKACREMCRVAKYGVIIRQEFPEEPIGWPGHSRVTIDSPHDILEHLRGPGWTARYDGIDFIARRE